MTKTVLAFSGGLDTCFCAAWLREQGHEVHTVTVQTGGFDADELATIERRARQLGAASHTAIDARRELFDSALKYLLFSNALRGGVYPLCVSAERLVQARLVAQHARKIEADALAHGSTGAGNDHIRFDVAFRVFAPDLPIIAPVRERDLTREQETAYLAAQGFELPAKTARYSINRGLWGVTIGGGETHDPQAELPEEAWILTAPPDRRPSEPETIHVDFDHGIPAALDGEVLDPVTLIEQLNERAAAHGVGRGIHTGDTIAGIKGRVAFEAPAARVLIAAHRELEKLVLSRQQQFWKNTLGELYGQLVHEARAFDPLARDLEAFLESSQRHVSGRVRVRLHNGQAAVVAVSSPHSLFDAQKVRYGESSTLWTGREAAAFAKLYGLSDWLAARREEAGA